MQDMHICHMIHRTIGKFLWFPLLRKFSNLHSKIDCHSKTCVCRDDDPLQRGFKKDCRTSDNSFMLYNLVETQTTRKKPLYVCYIDLTKAFDCLNRDALILKLQQSNLCFLNLAIKLNGMARLASLLKTVMVSRYGLKIGDIYLAYLLFADDIVLFRICREPTGTN